MASKLLRKIAPATTGEHVGSPKWFDKNCLGRELNINARDFGNNLAWRRAGRTAIELLAADKDPIDLFALIAKEYSDQADLDFEYIQALRGRESELAQLRRWIMDSHIWSELIRVAMDFTHVKSKRPESIAIVWIEFRSTIKYGKSLEERKKEKETLEKLSRRASDSQSFHVTNLAMRSPQRSPNAPNFMPALSLAAA